MQTSSRSCITLLADLSRDVLSVRSRTRPYLGVHCASWAWGWVATHGTRKVAVAFNYRGELQRLTQLLQEYRYRQYIRVPSPLPLKATF